MRKSTAFFVPVAIALACCALGAAAMPVYVDPQLDIDSVGEQHGFLYRLGERAALKSSRRAAAAAQCVAASGAKAPPDCRDEGKDDANAPAPAPPGKATSAWQIIKRSLPNLWP